MKWIGVVCFVAVAVASLVGALTGSPICWGAAGVPLIVLVLIVLRPRPYRPPENYQAVIYRNGRFRRIVGQDRWTVIIPLWERVHRENSLGMRNRPVALKEVYSRDQVPFHLEIKVFYRLDLSRVVPDFLPQAMQMPTEAFGEIIATNLESLARNTVFLHRSYKVLLTEAGRQSARQELSRRLAERVQRFGILINEGYGVSIQNLEPNTAYAKARQAYSAAATRGQELADWLSWLRENRAGVGVEDAQELLLFQMAARMDEQQPVSVVVQPETNYRRPPRGGNGNGRYTPPPPQPPGRPPLRQAPRPAPRAGD
jgi:hypothetical protein